MTALVRELIGRSNRVGDDTLELTEVYRFPNAPLEIDGALRWDVHALLTEVLLGLRAMGRVACDLAGVDIDSWADQGFVKPAMQGVLD